MKAKRRDYSHIIHQLTAIQYCIDKAQADLAWQLSRKISFFKNEIRAKCDYRDHTCGIEPYTHRECACTTCPVVDGSISMNDTQWYPDE